MSLLQSDNVILIDAALSVPICLSQLAGSLEWASRVCRLYGLAAFHKAISQALGQLGDGDQKLSWDQTHCRCPLSLPHLPSVKP